MTDYTPLTLADIDEEVLKEMDKNGYIYIKTKDQEIKVYPYTGRVTGVDQAHVINNTTGYIDALLGHYKRLYDQYEKLRNEKVV